MPNPNLKVLAGASAQIPLREEFLSSLVDVDTLEPASLKIFTLDPESDAVQEDGDAVVEANFVHMQSVQMPQEERVQMVISAADEGKLITFGRATRMYAISGFLVDSDNEREGHLMARWDNLYENYFRLSSCLKQRRIVRFKWRLSSFYGHLLSNIKGIEAGSPSICMVNFTFLSLYEQDATNIPSITLDNGETLDGHASYESLASLSLVPPLAEQLAEAAALQTAVGQVVKGAGRAVGNAARRGFF